jgi:hypothetical protein
VDERQTGDVTGAEDMRFRKGILIGKYVLYAKEIK